MDAAEIQKVTRLVDLQDLVTQVEAMPVLDAADVGPLLLPLTRLTSMKTYGHEGALLTERLLLTCLSRLPVEISDRYLTATTTTADATAAATKVCTIPTHFSSSGDATTSHTLPQQLRTTLPYPTTALYNRAMIAWGNLSTRQGAERAQLLFQWQLQEYVREKEYLRDQHSRSFRGTDGNDVVDSSSSSTSSAVYNQTMPPQPQQQLNQQRHHVAASLLLPAEPFAPPPDRRCYKSLIRAWAVSKDVKGAARAYDILQEMELLSGVTALLDGRGVTALRRQQQQQAEQKLPLIPPIEMPDMGTYNVVLSAYGKAFVLKHPNALERIRQIVQRVHDLHEATGSDEFQLDGYSYVSILQAYSRYVAYCPSPLDKKYSLEILAILRDIHQLLEKRRNDDNKLEQPPPPRYSEAYKKGLDDHPTKLDPDRSFLFPLSISWAYGVAVDALVKTEPFYESILLADDIVMAMARRPNRCTAPPSNVFDSLPPPLLTPSPPLSIPHFVATEIWPPHETLLRVVLGWERSGLPQAAERIERLLNIVVVGASYPRIYHMHETMELWCVSGWPAAPVLVEKILSRALSNYTGIVNKPTGQSFGIAMKAWMRSKQKESPYRAELLLQHMLHLYEDEGDSWYRPREVHTRYVTTCWLQRCKDGQRYDGISGKNMYPAEHCESLVLWLRGKDWFDKMAIGQYAMAIRAWATQQILTTENDGDDDNDPNPVLRASKLLDYYAESLSGRDELLLPAFLCNWVLAACLRWQPNVQRRLVAYDVAIETFKRCKHNARTFVLTVQVLRAQVPELDEEHLSVISDLFEQCCACGMLTQEMIAEVVDVVQPEALQRLFGLSYQMAQLIAAEGLKATENDNSFRARTPSVLLVGNLPQEWSVNAQMKGKPTDVCSNK